jgi:hypothetical protein
MGKNVAVGERGKGIGKEVGREGEMGKSKGDKGGIRWK